MMFGRHRTPYLRTVASAALLSLSALMALAQLEIVQPQAGAVLSGTIEVIARSDAPGLRGVHVYLAGRPWVAMTAGTDGAWHATLDTTLAPNGPATIGLQQWPVAEGGAPTVEVTLDNPLQWYWGDIHSHTAVSDGRLTPAAAYAYARDIAGIDFFSLTDHLEKISAEEWRECLRAAWEANDEGRFVTFAGLEWTKAVGHICLYDPIGTLWPEDLESLYTSAHGNCVSAKFNHPGWRGTSFNDFTYSPEGDAVIQLMEVRGPGELEWFIKALNLGWHLAPDGSDDTHLETWGNNNMWTVALAPGLTRANILHALESRRCYSTRDRNCRLLFTLNGAQMGAIIAEPQRAVNLVVEVDDPDAGDVIERIELYADGTNIQTDEPGLRARRWEVTLTPEPGHHYYFIVVTQADRDLIYGAPIWVTVAAEE